MTDTEEIKFPKNENGGCMPVQNVNVSKVISVLYFGILEILPVVVLDDLGDRYTAGFKVVGQGTRHTFCSTLPANCLFYWNL